MALHRTAIASHPHPKRSPNETGFGSFFSKDLALSDAHVDNSWESSETERLLKQSHELLRELRLAVEARNVEPVENT
jgi:hypothetical protein